MIERDAYAQGEHRWNSALLSVADDYGFIPKVCRPYRAKTKGKVERFNRYLKSSFVVPLRSTLKTSGLRLDLHTANGYIGRWLAQTANARVHGTTGDIPRARLLDERDALIPLPIGAGNLIVPVTHAVSPMPIESLQHPLSVYDQTGGLHELTI